MQNYIKIKISSFLEEIFLQRNQIQRKVVKENQLNRLSQL